MALRKGENPSLQEIIDSYNRELLSYQARAAMHQHNPPQAEPEAPHFAPPEHDIHFPHPHPEQKPPAPQTPIQPRTPKQENRQPFPGQLPLRELSEQLLDQLRRMPRPLPTEYPEPRDAEPASAVPDEEAAGRAEYLQGIRDLEQGLLDLAQGEKDLREGIEAYEQGIRERDSWQSVAAAAQPTPPFDPQFITDPKRIAAQDTGKKQSQSLGFGRLRINTSAARQAIPVEGAYVQVVKRTAQGDSLVGAASSNELGLTPFFELPVELSDDGGMTAPFEEYLVNVSARGYQPIVGLIAQVFAGISGTLPVFLVPLSEEERL